MTEPAISVFVSYSHRDEKLRAKLEEHLALLKREKFIRVWHDGHIRAGQPWEEEITENLRAADLILLLVSPAFIHSDFCYSEEMEQAMERYGAGEATVVPIILRPSDWKSAPFGKLQALPREGRPVTKWGNRDEAFSDVVLSLRAAISKILERRRDGSGEPEVPAGPSLAAAEEPAAEVPSPPSGRPAQRLRRLPKAPQAGDLWEDPKLKGLGLRLRYIPPGTFLMGSPKDEPGRWSNETQHQVTLTRGFWLGETLVTQAQWRAVMGNNPSSFQDHGDDCPVERVNWYEALAFANALSERAGLLPCCEFSGDNGKKAGEGLEYEAVRFSGPACLGYRLPTEAEWEYAARAGTTTALYTGKLTVNGENAGQELNAIAWWKGNSDIHTHPVGQKAANPWNLRDVLGNVWEWCWDGWDMSPYASDAVADPEGMEGAAFRVVRSSSWGNDLRLARVAYRDKADPSYRLDILGFRVLRSAL